MNLDRAMRFWLVAVTFSVTGFGLALVSGAMLARGYQAHDWSSTTARIVRSEVEVSRKAAGMRRIGRTVFDDYYSAKIGYEYTVDGTKYVGDQIAIGDTQDGFDRSTAEAAVKKYKLGSEVTIYYDPSYPNRSLIDRDFRFGIWWTALGCAATMGLVGVGLWVKAARISAANRAAAGTAEIATRHATVMRGPASRRPVHWALRTAYTIVGLASLFLGAVVLVSSMANGMPAGTNATAWLVMLAMMAGLAAVGGILVRKGMDRGDGAAA